MARPVKQTVDYFSHDANASKGRTLTIIFNNFGHEGLSAWWQLLETISSTRNHVIDIRNSENLEYLAANLHFQPDRLKVILDKLASLEAIDRELYKDGYIWSQNFVERLEPVYKARGQVVPIRPEVNHTNNPVSDTDNGISDTSRARPKETKETKGIKGNENHLPDWLDKDLWEAFLEIRKKKRMPVTDKAFQLMIKDLTNWRAGGDDPNKVIEQSVKRGWGGLFELKDRRSNGTHKQGPRALPTNYTKPEDI